MVNRWRYAVLAGLMCLLVILVTPVAAQAPLSAHQLGQQAYERGQLTQAVEHWQAAADEFVTDGDLRSQALTQIHLGIAHQDLGEWPIASQHLDQAQQLAQPLQDDFVTAQLLMAQGTQTLRQGDRTTALTLWQQAAAHYRSLNDPTGSIKSQINQAQALQTLGQYRQAAQQLQQLATTIQAMPATSLKVTGLHNLGTAMHGLGQWEQAIPPLTEGLELAQQLQLPRAAGDIHLSLGNVFRAQEDLPRALQHYQQAAQPSLPVSLQLTAQLNRLKVLIHQGHNAEALALVPHLRTLLHQLPPSRAEVDARVNFADSLMQLSPSPLAIARLLATGVQHARSLQDAKAEAYALGELGHLYERHQQWPEALRLTRTAVQLAQAHQAPEIAMPWQWQVGRILKAQGDRDGAIAAYRQAITTLKDLRQDLVALSPDVQFSFREQVEPVYRQLVQLLLTNVDTLPQQQQQQHLEQSRQLIEDLQLASLDNFFRQACLTGQTRTIDQIDQRAAVVYPIWLNQGRPNQRLEVIVSLPSADSRKFLHYSHVIPPEQSQQLWEHLQATLTPLYSPDEILSPAQTLYQWLLAPAEPLLTQHQIQTLVFVADGWLRNVPMAVLHDGHQFLVERYTLALSPGLQLLNSVSDKPLDLSQRPKALTSGLSQQRPGFVALPYVATELAQVKKITPSKVLLNQTFLADNLRSELANQPFSIVHLATHGQFSSNLDQTFLLTWDQRLKIQDLETVLSPQLYRQPLELLILSACQTARGDDRAALGLAGVAVRAGAKSILATLWSVADASTAEFITHFYENLINQNTKAEALRQAQLTLLKSKDYNHPYYWAPFVLVGHWR